jgi:hypothetical protein
MEWSFRGPVNPACLFGPLPWLDDAGILLATIVDMDAQAPLARRGRMVGWPYCCPYQANPRGLTMTDTNDASQEDTLRQGAALFLGQVLGLTDEPDYLAEDLSPIKRDANASIYTIQLDSSVGPAAFLVYAYILDKRGGEGRTGKELFDAGLATLQEAAQRSAPGPRSLAHAESGGHGYILATTPGTYRALTGDAGSGEGLEATTADLIAIADAQRIRGEAAERLLEILRIANDHATQWLDAVRLASQADDETIDDLLEFNDRETELALYLLDEQSIGNLLQALNLLVATAQEQAAAAYQQEDDDYR